MLDGLEIPFGRLQWQTLSQSLPPKLSLLAMSDEERPLTTGVLRKSHTSVGRTGEIRRKPNNWALLGS